MLTSRKILIVEDRGDPLDLLVEALALLGWETLRAESGLEAMNQLEHNMPSVVFLALGRPPMNGIELAASLKAHPVYKHIPILAAGGNSGELIRNVCLAAGCDDFISKPLAFAELAWRLNNLMAMERRRIIRASEPVNLESTTWKRDVSRAGHRHVA